MRLDKLTMKSQEALQQAQSLAEKRNHQAIDVEHLLFALLGQKEGVVLSLLQKLGVPVTSVTERLQRTLDRLAQVTGQPVKPSLRRGLRRPSKVRKRRLKRSKTNTFRRNICFSLWFRTVAKPAKFSKSLERRLIRF
jgi:ATP-dependent Clp protease ATP-binding subunit ClpA